MEEVIDSEIADAVQQFLRRLQSERDRIVQHLKSCPASSLPGVFSFQKSSEFQQNLTRLLATPFGSIDSVDEQQPNNASTSSASTSRTSGIGSASSLTSISSLILSPTAGQHHHRNTSNKSRYENMEVVAVVEGDDLNGMTIRQPTSICTLPRTNCIAVIHNSNRLSLLSTSTSILATFDICSSFSRGACSLRTNCLTADPLTGQLYCSERNSILCVKPSSSPSFNCQYQAKVCVNPSRDTTFGLAVTAPTRQIFTASGDCIVGYSLNDWSIKTRVHIENELDRFTSHVLFASDLPLPSHLFYSSQSGKTLNAIPIDVNGNLLGDDVKTLATGFREIRGVAIDQVGNILIADKGCARIQVIGPDGESVGSFSPSQSRYSSTFHPSGVVFMTSPTSAFKFGQHSYSSIVVAPDYESNRIFFFASPFDR